MAITVKESYLNSNEYLTYSKGDESHIKYIFIHHTAGWANPYAVVKDWNADARGKIGTRYIIGGVNHSNNDAQYDGLIVKCIPDNGWAYHLGGSEQGVNFTMHKYSVGIEICNFGYLTQKNGKFYTYTGAEIKKEFVVELSTPFNGYKFWHKYTDKQIQSLAFLIKELGKKYNIDINQGLKQRINNIGITKAFEYSKECASGLVYGVLSHTNVRKDKTDVSPQTLLVDTIINL